MLFFLLYIFFWGLKSVAWLVGIKTEPDGRPLDFACYLDLPTVVFAPVLPVLPVSCVAEHPFASTDGAGPICVPWSVIPAIVFFLWKFAKPLLPKDDAGTMRERDDWSRSEAIGVGAMGLEHVGATRNHDVPQYKDA